MTKITSRAPGRINIIGEHTDYNDGFVLPAAIDRTIDTTLAINSDPNICEITASDLGESHRFDLRDYRPTGTGWENYVMGVVSEMNKAGANIKGFTASFGGNVPIGGGVSSSAALENSLAIGLTKLFPNDLDPWTIIKACQMAEHNFVGIKCGIMDQFSTMMGKADQVMLLDCRSLAFNYFPLRLEDYQILLLNTNVSHALASSEYNTRRTECEEGVNLLRPNIANIKNLRDVSPVELEKNKSILPPIIYQRCHHVVSENARVLKATSALQASRLADVGQLMYQSHESLSADYAVSCDQLDFLVELTKNNTDIIGSRMMGGGFGGCTINIIKKKATEFFIEKAGLAYRDQFGIDLTPMEINIADGAWMDAKLDG